MAIATSSDASPPAESDPVAAALRRAQEYQLAALQHVEDDAEHAGDAVTRSAGFIAVLRQCARIQRVVDGMQSRATVAAHVQLLADYLGCVDAVRQRAERNLASMDAKTWAAAVRRAGVRVAISGKGGSGKTFIAATLARVLAESGRRVLAVDLDTSPGLSYGLGLPSNDGGLPADALDPETGALRAADIGPEAAIEQLAARDSAGVRVLSMGKLGAGGGAALQRSVGPLGTLLYSFGSPGWDVVVDLDAGLRSTVFGYHNFADTLIIVLNPNVKSTLTVRRLLRAAEHWRPIVVANAWSEEAPPAGIEPDLYVPFDPRVAQAERDAVPVVERYPDSPAVAEIRALARSLLNRAVEGACTSPLHAPFRTA